MLIASFQCADSGIAAREMAKAVAVLAESGVRIAGVVEDRDPASAARRAAGTLRNISTAESNKIYLDTTREDTSCRVDALGIGAACDRVMLEIAGADLVVLSKFGKLEAEGDGLYPALEAAFEAGKPVLTAVSKDYRKRWEALTPSGVIVTDCDEALAWYASLAANNPRLTGAMR